MTKKQLTEHILKLLDNPEDWQTGYCTFDHFPSKISLWDCRTIHVYRPEKVGFGLIGTVRVFLKVRQVKRQIIIAKITESIKPTEPIPSKPGSYKQGDWAN